MTDGPKKPPLWKDVRDSQLNVNLHCLNCLSENVKLDENSDIHCRNVECLYVESKDGFIKKVAMMSPFQPVTVNVRILEHQRYAE